jgi:hypothetical protein
MSIAPLQWPPHAEIILSSTDWAKLILREHGTDVLGQPTMSTPDKLLVRILLGASDANIPFDGMCGLLRSLGFQERTRGDHHIFTKEDVEEILNLQPRGAKAKPYQVKQVRNTILKYKLGEPRDDQV